ncbi:MAG: Asp-tRNA(Asn)/Glu-tRNA(Gln) amidotransferase subunit GatA [Magnetococcales bacterium]|nr:Asp-tRNA(Asn)/Glu-tRNA(Gln) amidotransferase subunit GatA [Magnetococcales bacterium]MBF0151283.1 Asp-tRNA(Asn)/Glu-tRNA(Gln) amidotransferase subunit GatA [Magnetococcales bacterium]MBF0631629.1 Asp-tRNA(Asn)/Glu-tRNA(Gln) amidotransferase subunit GatA [Magnetococcales bacterium]
MDPTQITLVQAHAMLRSRQISARELTTAFLERIARINPIINAFITVDGEGAMAAARMADERLAQGTATPMTGIPVGVKDLFCTQHLTTTCGSKMLARFRPPYESTVTRKLKEAGAVILGKTNMDEFAMGSSNETSWFGPVRNPWDIRRIPGGSSGGSAAALAARLALATIGSDTGGSIRQPAALTGTTGLKPTYGRISRFGMIAFASSLDQAGPMAWSAADAAMVLQVIAGHDAMDSTSIRDDVPDYSAHLSTRMEGLRIGIPAEYHPESLNPEIGQALDEAGRVFGALGATLVPVSLPHTRHAIPTYYIIAPAEASSNLARFDGVRFGHRCQDPVDLKDMYTRTRSEGFGAEVKRRIMLGTYVLSSGYYDAYYRKAQKVRRLIADDFHQAFQKVDLLLTPTTPGTAFPLGEKIDDPVAMYLSDLFTINVNLAGLPGISIPCGSDSQGLPIGMQLIAPILKEAPLLSAAHAFQTATSWHQRKPEL